MRCTGHALIFLAVTALLAAATAWPAEANAPAPRVTIAFEFVDENGQPVKPIALQLATYQQYREQLVVHHSFGTCDLPACLEVIEGDANIIVRSFTCTENRCFSDIETFRIGETQHMVLAPESATPLDTALTGTFPGRAVSTGQVAGWRVVVTPGGLVISEDEGAAAGAPVYQSSSSCSATPSPAMVGFAITQVAELLAGSLLLLLLGIRLRLIGGVLAAVVLINFATFPVVWFTFPALGAGSTTQAQAVAVFTLLAALLYAGLLVWLRPAFDPARRKVVIGLLAVVLPMVTALVFGAASVASAAADALGAAGTGGAGLPYCATMPASEVFAYSAEAVLLFLLCRPVLSARQAALLSVLANSASLMLGLMVL